MGYLLTFPQSFATSETADRDSGTSERVCLQMFNVEAPGTVTVGVYAKSDLLNGSAAATVAFEHAAGDGGVNCKDVQLPADYPTGSAIVKVEGAFEGSGYKILSYKSVRTLKQEPLLLIQTDKADYRPKQAVKIR